MVGHGGSSAGSYLADPTSPIPSHCASIVATSTVRVNKCNTIKLPLTTHETSQSDQLREVVNLQNLGMNYWVKFDPIWGPNYMF